MNRREFVKGSLALAGAASLVKIGMAEEGTKKMDKKCMVVYFSWGGKHALRGGDDREEGGGDDVRDQGGEALQPRLP